MRELCNYCLLPIGSVVEVADRQFRLKKQVDHFIPLSLGGADTDDNKVLACHLCNVLKKAHMFSTIREATLFIVEYRTEHGFEVISEPDPGRVDANLQKETEDDKTFNLPGVRVRRKSEVECRKVQRQVPVESSYEAIQAANQGRTSLCPHAITGRKGKNLRWCFACKVFIDFPDPPHFEAIGTAMNPPLGRNKWGITVSDAQLAETRKRILGFRA